VTQPVHAAILRDALAARAADERPSVAYRAFRRQPEFPAPPGVQALPDGRPTAQRTGYYAVLDERTC
jgi:hypothetical protein